MPTTLDLVAGADAVVLATVREARHREAESSLLLTPILALKGRAPKAVVLPGAWLLTDPRLRPINGNPPVPLIRSAPRELRRPHPNALDGGCVRRVFARDMQVVVFLQRDRFGRLIPVRSPFARDAEDVRGPGALWVKAVREHVIVAAYPRREWPHRLRARATALRAGGGVDAAALAADLEIEARERR